MFISFNQEILTGIKWPTRWWNSATKVSLSVVFFYVMQNQSSVIFFVVLVSCQSVSELHRPDRVSLHVALLLSAHLLWRNAHHRQCDHSQRHGCHWQDCWQGAHTQTQIKSNRFQPVLVDATLQRTHNLVNIITLSSVKDEVHPRLTTNLKV